jgi:hypothetical protein
MIICIDRELRRVFVLGKRVHHGLAGAAIALIGVALVIHDRKDWRQWL